jgi:hypothetical protein
MLFPGSVIRSDDLSRVMVDVSVQELAKPECRIFENRDIIAMARSNPAAAIG